MPLIGSRITPIPAPAPGAPPVAPLTPVAPVAPTLPGSAPPGTIEAPLPSGGAPTAASGQPLPAPSTSALRLRGAQLGGVEAALVAAVASARGAIDARAAAGFDPTYPIGERGPLVPLGGSFGVRCSGGSNHTAGSLVVVDPASATAHHVKHGFADYAMRPLPELGGRMAIEALGGPIGEEVSVDASHAMQKFTHGELHWTYARGVWFEPPDLLAKRAPAVAATHAPRTDLPVDDALRDLARDLGHALSHTSARALGKAELELCACDPALPSRLRDACASIANDAATLTAFDLVGGITKQTLAARTMSTWLQPLSFHGEDHGSYFLYWAQKQLQANPIIGALHADVRALLESPQKPARMTSLYDTVRAMAARKLEGETRVGGDDKAHLVNVTALVAMAALSLKNDHSPAIAGFPPFMWDGRGNDAAWDKAWHFTNHAMMAYVARFDAEVGDGVTRTEFGHAVDKADAAGAAQRVARTYDERKGALGAFVGQVLGGPLDEESTLYAPRPSDLSDDEARVYDLAVRIGDAHEHASSGDSFPIGIDDIGDTSKRFDPLAEIHSRFGRVWGLQDHGVARDLTANRLGARFAIELFRAPSAPSSIPHDDGKLALTGAYASVANGGRPISYAHYVAEERTMVAVMRGAGDGPALYAKHLEEARALGKDASTKALESEVLGLVDDLLAGGKHDELSRFYGAFAVRHLRWGERLNGFAVDESFWAPDSSKHRDWAAWSLQNGKAADVKNGFAVRLTASFASM